MTKNKEAETRQRVYNIVKTLRDKNYSYNEIE